MNLVAPGLTVIALIGGLLAAMAGLSKAGRHFDWPAELQRKLVHVAAGLTAMALPWIFTEDWPVWCLLGLTLLAMLALRSPRMAVLGRTVHGVERRSWGDILLVVAVGLVFLFSDREPVLYILPLAILTLADAAAALAGARYGTVRFAVADGQKSVEGSAVFFVVTFCVTIAALLVFSPLDRISVLIVSVLIAAFATLVEADSWNGFDNLFLPLGTMILLRSADLTSAEGLAIRLGVLFVVIVGAIILSRRRGARAHVLRVYILALFLILNVTALQNALLPMIMLMAQAASRARTTGPEAHRAALEAVGALALLSFGSEALGAATGRNALSFYALAIGAMALGHLVLLQSRNTLWHRLVMVLIAGAPLFALWLWVAWLNPPSVHWYTAPSTVFALVLVLPSLAAALRPGAFATQTSLRLALLAGCCSVGLFAQQMIWNLP